MDKVTTLAEFNEQHFALNGEHADGLTRIFNALQTAAIDVAHKVNVAGLADIAGAVGTENVQGEEQQKLDVIADNTFIDAFKEFGAVCAVASEERKDLVQLDPNGQYVIMIDPLDGSSNIDVGVSIGTIFSIYKRVSPNGPAVNGDALQAGSEQIAAGYVLYGTSTMLVFTSGNGVNGFTLDPSNNKFCLSHPDLKIPEGGKIYSINEGNLNHLPEGVKRYIEYCQSDKNDLGKPYTARYIGSLVADVHRNLLKGGIYIYPSTHSAPNGKLRLLYECNPMSFVIEQAGGRSSNGKERIMEILPSELHQRVPLFIGSGPMVNRAQEDMAHFS